MKRCVATLFLCVLAACGASAPVNHLDAGLPGLPDAGPDCGPFTDAGAPDAGLPGPPDAGPDGGLLTDAGAQDAGPCLPDGSAGVLFELQYDGPVCVGPICSEQWLYLSDSSGAAVTFLPGWGQVQCDSCDQCVPTNSCDPYLACPYNPPETGPLTFLWNGTIYGASQCSNGMGCTTSSCAAPGTYTATICLHAAGPADSNQCSAPVCRTLSFQWPPIAAGATVAYAP